MIPEYQFYHGALLHEIVISAEHEISLALEDSFGRRDAYVIDGKIGVLIKYSTARITPWFFTFTKEHMTELRELRLKTDLCFICLICEEDGFVCIRDLDLVGILKPTDTDVASVRIDRRPRQMYRVSSSGMPLNGKVARGVQEIVAEITRRRNELAIG